MKITSAEKIFDGLQLLFLSTRHAQKPFGKILHHELKFKFEFDKKLVCGVALQADEQLIDWNLAGYMNEFQKNMQNDVQQLINRG